MKRHFLLLLGLFCATTANVWAINYTPTLFTDPPVSGGVNSANGVITGGAGNGQVSLRSAVVAANATGGVNAITLGAGTYQLTIAGTGETAASGDATIGDLDVLATITAGTRNTLTVQGAGTGSTTIQQTSGIDRIFDAHPVNVAGSITFILMNVTIKGGTLASSSGGAILAGRPGDVTTLVNCVFDGNAAPSNGGAISASSGSAGHDLNITNCVFLNNTATAAVGGAVNYSGLGTVNITRTVFSNNVAGTQGGAVNLTGTGSGGTYNIFTSTFLNNTANGATFGGAAISIVNGVALNVGFNRFSGNTAGAVATGKTISTGGGVVTTFDVNRNWWGRNTGPLASDVLGTAPTVWLQLRNSASPPTVNVGSTATVSADIFGLNTGGATAPGNLTGLPAFPSSGTVFGNVQRGTIPGGAIQFLNGAATVVFTGTTGGAGGVDAVADSQTVTAPITVNVPPAITSATNTTFTVGINGVFNVSRTGVPTPDLFISGTFPNGVGFNSGTGNLAGTPAAGTGGTYPLVITATNVAGTNVQNFTLTVLQAPAMSCPPNITTNAFGSCPRTIAFAATVTGGFPAPALSYKIGATPITSPYAFPVGTNIVTATATNSVGTNSCNFTVTVAAGPAPQLTAFRTGTNIVVSWTNSFGCYALQTAPVLSSNSWSLYPGPFTTNVGNIFVTNGVGASNRFFRLAY